jgi:fructose-1,6-bisphosphatase/inositol monophosphatase family enzyme
LFYQVRAVRERRVRGYAAITIATLAAGRIVASLLFEVQPDDPRIIAAVVALVALVGLLTRVAATRQGCRSIPPVRFARTRSVSE